MHIAFLNPQGNFDAKDSYWTEHPDFGGQLVYVKELAIAMAAKGHKVDIITRQIIDSKWPEFASPVGQYSDVPNVTILRIPCGPKHFLPKEELWPYLGTDWVQNVLNFYQSAGFFPDVFTAHYGDGGLAAAMLSQAMERPFTFTGHSLGAQKMDKLNANAENLGELEQRFQFSKRILAERISMNHAGQVITSTGQERIEQYGHRAYHGAINPKDDKKFSVIPPGVNRKVFSQNKSAIDPDIKKRIKKSLKRDLPKKRRKLPIVLVSSRLDPKKNHIGVVKAFAVSEILRSKANLGIVVRTLEDPLHDYQSLTVAEQRVLDEIVSTIEEHQLWDCVTAFPLNSQAELAAAYRVLSKQKSIFALTALYEPFGLAPLEAMSCGLPAVVTQNGGPSESMIDGKQEFGVLVDPADPNDIVTGILRIIDSPKSWKKFHKAGIDRVISKYTWERTAEGYLQVLIKLKESESPQNQIEIHPWFTNPSSKNEIKLNSLESLYLK